MNKKYFFLLFVSTLFYCHSLSALATNRKLNNLKEVRIADTVRWMKMGTYDGRDSTFVKGQSPSTGVAGCTTINKQIGGIKITISYTLNSQEGTSSPVVSNVQLTSRRSTLGKDPIKHVTCVTEIKGTKIAFSIGAIDIINWQGKPWGAPTVINGIYDTSTGEYSMQIDQQTPENR